MKLLVTGGAGFIGSNFIRYFLSAHPADRVLNLDLLTYAGNLENLAGVPESAPGRYEFVHGDIADADLLTRVMADGITHVINFAAESHVDRSIVSATPFLHTNVVGTQVLADAARAAGIHLFLQVSTDEVYGQLGPDAPAFTEDHPLAPRSPYAASKAAADLLVLAAHDTHGFPAVITRCSNNYGPYQFPEKLLPLIITNALEGKPLPIYGDGLYIRDWIYVTDHCRALDLVLRRGRPGAVYNVGGYAQSSEQELLESVLAEMAKSTGRAFSDLQALVRPVQEKTEGGGGERTNIGLVRAVLGELSMVTGRPMKEYEDLITSVKDRPGHDRRYAIDSRRLRAELGYEPEVSLARGLALTVAWYLENRSWWERVKSGAYQHHYEAVYGQS